MMRIIGGRFRNQPLHSPKTKIVRPTLSQVRAAVFNICQNQIPGCHFLDVFAGSGAMGLEALSRDAKLAVFIEQDIAALRCLKLNIKKLQVNEESQIYVGDSMFLLEKLAKKNYKFEIIYIDPPYAKKGLWHGSMISLGEKAIRLIDQFGLLAHNGTLFIETGTTGAIQNLSSITFRNERRFASSFLQVYDHNYL